jgi:hypothetical protein
MRAMVGLALLDPPYIKGGFRAGLAAGRIRTKSVPISLMTNWQGIKFACLFQQSSDMFDLTGLLGCTHQFAGGECGRLVPRIAPLT